jgi:hypothetical protein
MQLETPVPHLDLCHRQGTASEQGRIGMQSLEVAADGDRLRDHRAVVEHQRGNPHERVDRRIGRGLVLQRTKVHLLDRQADVLLGQENPRASRIGRPSAVIKLHVDRHASRPPQSTTWTCGCKLPLLHSTTAFIPW